MVNVNFIRLNKEISDVLVQWEMRLAQRETQMTNDLSIERSKLMELNEQLTKLELELPRLW